MIAGFNLLMATLFYPLEILPHNNIPCLTALLVVEIHYASCTDGPETGHNSAVLCVTKDFAVTAGQK